LHPADVEKRRETTMRSIETRLACALLLAAVAGPARGEDIYVDASAAAPGDGTAARPFPTITAGLARARADRRTGAILATETIAVHVAAGTYLGSFAASGPGLEALPLLLDVPNLALSGATVLALDASNWPTGAVKGTETILTVPSNEPLPPAGTVHPLILVGPTIAPVYGLETGDDVAVSGFVLDGGSTANHLPNDAVSEGVFLDRVQGALVRANVVQRVVVGVYSRLSGCTVEGNLISETERPGVALSGGSTLSPASVAVCGNRISGMTNGILLDGAGEVATLPDLGTEAGAFSLATLHTTYDLATDAANLPDTLCATVTRNEVTNCFYTSLHLAVIGAFPYGTADASQPVAGHIVACASGNVFTHNQNFGLFVGAFPPRSDPREYTGTVALDLAGNDLSKNSAAPAFFGFTAVYVEVSPPNKFGAENPGEKYLQDATFRVCASDDELDGFGFDLPLVDPLDGTALDDTLIVNHAPIPPGTTR
jgi:hypothetical protein